MTTIAAEETSRTYIQHPRNQVVIFPYDGHGKDGTATGYVFNRPAAEQIRKDYPTSTMEPSRKNGHREHWHYRTGPYFKQFETYGTAGKMQKKTI